jgi:hypothetical protein
MLWSYVEVSQWANGSLNIDHQPQVQAIQCSPSFEKANASITVSVNDGTILEYEILDTPRPMPEAWLDDFQQNWYNISDVEDNLHWNYTIRYISFENQKPLTKI